MPKFSFELDVRDPPAKVIAAMVDFSQRCPEIWPNLTARLYQVHELSSTSADVTEGSRIGVDYHRRSKTLVGRCAGAMLQLTGGAPIKRTFRQVYGKPA